MSSSGVHASRSHSGGDDLWSPARPPSSSITPNRARSAVVAQTPPSCIAEPTTSQVISASCAAPSGAHTSSLIRSAIRRPAARSQTQPSTSVSQERYSNAAPCSRAATSVVR